MSDEWLYGEDPKLYPFDTARLRRVIETAASEAGWGRTLPQGHGLGIGAHRSFVSYTAVIVEVAIGANGELAIPRVDVAFVILHPACCSGTDGAADGHRSCDQRRLRGLVQRSGS